MNRPQFDKEKELELMERKPLYFGKVIMPKMFKVPSARFHYELEEAYLNKSLKKINTIAPRNHAKSSVITGNFATHHLLTGEGQKVIVIVSQTQPLAVRALNKIKNLLNKSEMIRYFYGDLGEKTARIWRSDHIVLANGNAIYALGMGQQVTGFKVDDQRITLLILDDPENDDNTKTAEAMEDNFDKLVKEYVPALDVARGRIWVVGTPQKENCIVERLKDMEGWTTFWYDSIVNEERKEVLWEEQISWNFLMEEKRSYESVGKAHLFASEYRCVVRGADDNLFTKQMFKYWDGELVIKPNGYSYLAIKVLDNNLLDEIEYRPVNVFTGIDPASSVADTADYSVIYTVAVDANMNIFCLPYVRQRLKPYDLVTRIQIENKKYRPHHTRVEVNGYQQMLAEAVHRMELFHGAIIKETARNEKNNRLGSLHNFYATGKVYHKMDMKEFENELLFYPRSKHDDIMDAFYYATFKVYPPSHYYLGDKNDRYEDEEESVSWKSA